MHDHQGDEADFACNCYEVGNANGWVGGRLEVFAELEREAPDLYERWQQIRLANQSPEAIEAERELFEMLEEADRNEEKYSRERRPNQSRYAHEDDEAIQPLTAEVTVQAFLERADLVPRPPVAYALAEERLSLLAQLSDLKAEHGESSEPYLNCLSRLRTVEGYIDVARRAFAKRAGGTRREEFD